MRERHLLRDLHSIQYDLCILISVRLSLFLFIMKGLHKILKQKINFKLISYPSFFAIINIYSQIFPAVITNLCHFFDFVVVLHNESKAHDHQTIHKKINVKFH